jgi:adenosylcobinamide-phosphate guanylyltransferase
MGVTAVVMAGGKGSRMAFSTEKPLVQVGGKPLIEHVLRSLQEARKVDSIVVAVSDFTPRTAGFAGRFPVRVLKTPGIDFVSDLQFAVKELGLGTVLAIGADLPLVTGEVIDAVLERFELCGKPALAVVVPVETKVKLGLSLEYAFELAGKTVVPAGINVVDGRRIDEEELDQEVCVMDGKEVAVNVNTPDELELAEALFKKSV